MNIRNIYLGLIALSILLLSLSCEKEKTTEVLQPDFIQTSLPATLLVDGGEEFELFIPDNEEGVSYIWTVPDMLDIVEGQGTNRIKVMSTVDEGIIPEKSIGVVADKEGMKSYTRWLYRDITIIPPVPTLENYRTKRYGAKTWMIENLNEAGTSGNLGRAYNNDPAKAEIHGRLYTWHEAMTGIPDATTNPYTWGSSGTDDAGNPYTIDGTYANMHNIQIQGACPQGWHVPNMNDWYDLVIAIKQEYDIPGNTLSDIGNTKDGYIIGWSREGGIRSNNQALNLTNWGIVAPYLKASSSQSAGGLWEGGTTFHYGGNADFPGGDYPLFKELSSEIGFNILPSGRRTAAGVFNDEGRYSYHWVAYRNADATNNSLRVTVGFNSANLSSAYHNPLDSFCLRCVANY